MTYDLVGNRTGLTATPLSGSTPCSGTPTANTYTLGACGSTGANTGNQRNWYNGDGLRVRARTFVSGRRDDDFVWDVGAGLPVVLQDTLTPQSGSPTTTTYLYGLGLVLETVGSNSYFYLSDGLGSTTELTDTSATVQNAYQYDVWGSLRATSGSTANQFEFAGQQTDHNANRGLQYLRARYYDPSLGRFISRDPLPFSNRYSYGLDNPTNVADPYGAFPCPGCSKLKKATKATVTAVTSAAKSVSDATADCVGNHHLVGGCGTLLQLADLVPLAESCAVGGAIIGAGRRTGGGRRSL